MITTNIKLSFKKTMKIYSTRWTIDVFFKEAKQLLGLGKCQSTNFFVKVVQTTNNDGTVFIDKLEAQDRSLPDHWSIFKNLKQDYVEYKLEKRLLLAIVDILEVLHLFVKDIDINSIARRLVLYSESLSFLTNLLDPTNNNKLGAK